MSNVLHSDAERGEGKMQRESAMRSSRDDRARMLRAMSALESALAAGAVSRQVAWQRRVMAALRVLEDAMESQTKELDSGQGVLAMILEQAPRFERPVLQLRDHYADLVRQIQTLRKQFGSTDDRDAQNVAEIRQRLSWLLTAIRHFQARESDLLQDAFQVDIGVGD